jgi:predicted AlkP superfamily pyrophosphatase or phosphodiesterase
MDESACQLPSSFEFASFRDILFATTSIQPQAPQQEAGTGMLNTASVNAVNGSQFSQRFVKPLYGSYCFSNIPQTIEFLLTGEGQSGLPLDVFGKQPRMPRKYDKVILFFVDAFGWHFFERYAEKSEFLKTILNAGVVSKMTSQFPSTTAAHTTSIHTGLNVGQSGVYEWHYYEPLVDDIISPLLFSYARDRFEKDTLKRSAVPAAAFYPRQTFYQTLKSKGVVSYIFQHQSYTPSTFSEAVFQGASIVPFKSITEALTLLAETVVAQKAPPYYYFLYFDRIDSACHFYGQNAEQFEKEVESFLTLVDQLFYKKLHGKVKDTLFIMTADHGQVAVDPQRTFYLNKHATGIERFLQTNRQGRLLVPAGSARDMFLYIREEYMDEAVMYLQKHLAGRAEVYRTADLIAQHFFGLQEPSPEFLSRVGNVVILPYENETVWWYEEGRFVMRFLSHHGGLTPAEVEIPFMVLPI